MQAARSKDAQAVAEGPRPQDPDLAQTLEQDFYQKLVLHKILAPYNGSHIPRKSEQEHEVVNEQELRRNFLDRLSYLCDIRKEGGTVTASALQELLHGNVLWLAANEGISTEVKAFGEWTFERLRDMTGNNVSMSRTQKTILKRAFALANQRISFYQSHLRKKIETCSGQLLSPPHGDDKGSTTANILLSCTDILIAKRLATWLRKFRNAERHPMGVALMCYEARSKQLVELKARSSAPDDVVRDVAHYISRLGAHHHAVIVIVKAWSEVKSLRKIILVRTVVPADAKSIKLPAKTLNTYAIVKNICAKQHDRHQAKRYLRTFADIDFEEALEKPMSENICFKSRVHAEILLLEEFARHKHGFVDNDRYIGCSKGACYFCYNWIILHHKCFVQPASHNKIILGCRGDDRDLNKSGWKYYIEMLGKMIYAVEQDILRQLESPSAIRFQHLSTSGSSRVPSTRAS